MALACSPALFLSSCFHDDEPVDEKYKEWKEQNDQYVTREMERTDENGEPYYTKIVPSWAPETFTLVHWHNDRKLTENKLMPISTSTVDITYELFDINGEKISDSFSNRDSIYTSRPNQNIIGVWAALTSMHEGDSVTLVIPSQAGYGKATYSDIKPYSTLIYNIKLKAIPAYEIP